MPGVEGHLINPDEAGSKRHHAPEIALEDHSICLDVLSLGVNDPKLRYLIRVPQVLLEYCLQSRKLQGPRLWEH